MNQHHDAAIRRRPDGSIDTDFYARRAVLLRCAAQKDEPARWIRSVGRAVTSLAGAARFGIGFARSRLAR